MCRMCVVCVPYVCGTCVVHTLHFTQSCYLNCFGKTILLKKIVLSMKIYLRCITIAIINILVLTSCHKKDTPAPVSLTLAADKTSITGSASAGKDSVQITSNTNWSISNIPSWATVTPSSGNGNTKVYINYTANTETSSRNVTLTLKATGVNDININITQAAFNPALTADKISFTERSSAG